MKNKKITITIGIIVSLIIILLGVMTLSIIKPETPKKEKTEKDKFSSYLENFKTANYKAELVYYSESPEIENINHVLLTYYYLNDIEKYYYLQENTEEVNQYNDYKNKQKYEKEPDDNYKTTDLTSKSNHQLLVNLLNKAKTTKQDNTAYTLEVSRKKIKQFLEEFHKIADKALKYSESAEYEIIVATENNNISNIIIKEKEDDSKNIIYTFDKIGEISEIQLPKNAK